jgi:hypothetical protein
MQRLYICAQCGHVGKPRFAAKGSLGVEILLWFFFLLPGFIYSVWRLSSKSNSCVQCKSPSLVPVTSPGAKRLFESTGQNQADYLETATKVDETVTKRDKTKKVLIVVIALIFTTMMVIAFSQ